MLTISSNLYLINMFFSMNILLLIFNALYEDSNFSFKKRIIIYFFVVIIFFISEILFNGMVEIFFPVLLYLIYKEKKNNSYLISIILITFIIYNVSLVFVTMIINYLVNLIGKENIVPISLLIQSMISGLIVILILRLNLRSKLKSQHSMLLNLLLGYSYLIMFFLIISVQYFEAYLDFINGLIIFLLIQSLFIILIFSLEKKRQKKYYNERLYREQLKNLKNYTDQLEHGQLSLRRFKHDYKNLLHGLELNIRNKNYQDLQKYLNSLSSYSDTYLNNMSTEVYRDLGNIQIPYLKSLLISKLNQIIQKEIQCSFECSRPLKKVPVNEFDLVRILGITIDNSIESTENAVDGTIYISIINLAESITFIIKNTNISTEKVTNLSKQGYTSKTGHSGFGLSNITEIQKKYSNLIVNYSNKRDFFTIEITLMKGVSDGNHGTNM